MFSVLEKKKPTLAQDDSQEGRCKVRAANDRLARCIPENLYAQSTRAEPRDEDDHGVVMESSA